MRLGLQAAAELFGVSLRYLVAEEEDLSGIANSKGLRGGVALW